MKVTNTASGARGRTNPKITPNNNAVSSSLPISPIHADRSMAWWPRSRVGVSSLCGQKGVRHDRRRAAERRRHRGNAAEPCPAHRCRDDAHARLCEQRHWDDVLDVHNL